MEESVMQNRCHGAEDENDVQINVQKCDAGQEELSEPSDLYKIMQQFQLPKQDYRSFSALTLAYMGDCIYELVVRTTVVMKNHKQVNDLHKKTVRYVKAETQSAIIQALLDAKLLTEEEKAVYKRGRNTKSHTIAKNASMADYRKATGFEALLGYLYLTGQMDRLLALVQAGAAAAGLEL